MQGSLYPDGVTVDRVALRRTELTKAAEILRDRNVLTSGGILTGNPVVVSTGTPTRIDVPAFSGFAPNGEFIEVPAHLNQSLASDVLTTINLVCAFYTENNVHVQPHESNGRTYPVRSEASYRFRILTQAQYDALAETDSNLANDAKDRCLVRAKVTSNAGMDLTSASINMPVVFGNFRYTVPASGAAITGVHFRSVSSDTPLGAGTLTYTYVASPLSYTFTWASAGLSAGDPVVVAADGVYSLGDSGGNIVQIEFTLATLPVTGTFPMTETFMVEDLYFQDMPRFTGEDVLHRSMKGTGTYSPNNPHGQSLDDFAGESLSLLDEHQNVHHTNGIWRGSNATCLISSVSENVGDDSLFIQKPVNADLYYVNGKKLSTIDIENLSFDLAHPGPSDPLAHYYEVYVSNAGSVEYLKKASFPGLRNCTGCWIVNMSENYPATSAGRLAIDYVSSGSGYWTFSWQNGPEVQVNVGEESQVIRLYARSNIQWIDLFVNTVYNPINQDYYLPTVAVSDNISVLASRTQNNDAYMIISGVSYWYTSGKWAMGYDPQGSSRGAVDLRKWGTLGPENLSSRVYDELLYTPLNEQGRSGVLKFRNKPTNVFDLVDSGSTYTVRGGTMYCRGKRVTATYTSVSLLSNKKYVIWCDYQGQITAEVLTGGKTLQSVMRNVLGTSLDREDISSIYQSESSMDAPERGVLLWYVEMGSTSISLQVDMMQNVNQVMDPWSVGGALPSNGRGSRAAYSNLFAAFAYAEYYSQFDGGCPTLKITGPVTINEKVEQPAGCRVEGAGGTVTINASEGTSTYEKWKLNEGCTVSGVKIVGNDFGGSRCIFSAAKDVLIENCQVSFDSDGCLLRAHSEDATTTSCDDVTVRGNRIIDGALVRSSSDEYGDDFKRWKIINNTVGGPSGLAWVVSGPSPSLTSVYMRQLNLSEISGNIFRIACSGDIGTFFAVVNVFESTGVSIQGNVFAVGTIASTDTTIQAIRAGNCDKISIQGNMVENAGGVKGRIVGVRIYNSAISSNIQVCDNSFYDLVVAISSSGSLHNCSFDNNNLLQLYGRGIDVELLNDMRTESLSICGNSISNCTYDPPAGSDYYGEAFAAIQVETSSTTFIGYVKNLEVSRNKITDMTVAGVNVYGIRLVLQSLNSSASFNNINCRENTIYGLVWSPETLSTDLLQRGIVVNGSTGSGQQLSTVNVSGNTIKFASWCSDPDSNNAIGIYVADVSVCSVSKNVVDITTPSGQTGLVLSAGIYVSHATGTLVSENVIDVPATGIVCTLTEGVSICGNRISVTGTGIYLNESDNTLMPVVENNRVVASVQSSGTDVLVASVSPYGEGGSYGFLNGSSTNKLTLKGNYFKVSGDLAWHQSRSVRLNSILEMNILDNYVLMDVNDSKGTIGVEKPSTFCVILASSGVTRLDIKNCIISDNSVSGIMSTPSDWGGLYVIPASGWNPASCALTGLISGNTFNTSHSENDASGYNLFNKEGNGVASPQSYPYCIGMHYLPEEGSGAKKHRSLLSFKDNMINSVISGTENDGGADHLIAKVYLPRYETFHYGGTGIYFQGYCVYEMDCDSISSLDDAKYALSTNRVTYNGGVNMGTDWLGRLKGTCWI